MSAIGAKQFLKLRQSLKAMNKQTDLASLEKVRNEILQFSPDLNALTLSRLYNLTTKTIRHSYSDELLIDIAHIKNLISLRKAALFAQSINEDIAPHSYAHALLPQLDWSIYLKAHALANNEKIKYKRRFYVDYFNTEILARLLPLNSELEADRLEYKLSPGFLKTLHQEEVIVH